MPIAPKINFQVFDNDADDAGTSIHVPSGFTVAQYGTFANDYANAMDDIALGRVDTKATMTIPVDISGLTGNTLDPASDVEQIAAFQFLDTNGEPVDVNVPGLLLADVVAGTDGLNTADTEIAAFITLMETGNGTIAPTSVAEADIIDTLYARKETRASGRKRR
jgi:hypothetical protein